MSNSINKLKKVAYKRVRWLSLLPVVFWIGLMPTNAQAHRGAPDEVDACVTQVGFERVHLTAYTPTLSAGREYCSIIPEIGPTNLVVDYEGKSLRNISVEFEITKEPQGQRVFYQKPRKVKSGTFNSLVDFSQYGAGNYLAHIAIVDKDKRLDTHIPFSVGLESVPGKSNMLKFALIVSLLILAYILIRAVKKETPDHRPEG